MRGIAEVDFETQEIINASPTPPEPVGIAIKVPGKKAEYWAYGHPEGNNCSKEQAARRYKDVCEEYDINAHYAAFDYDVGATHLGIKPKHKIHCSQVASFLKNPHAMTLELKEICKTELNIQPEERDRLREWIFANVPGAKQKKSEWGKYISRAPGSVVAPYAKDDVNLCGKLGKQARKYIHDHNMDAAYEREMTLVPIITEMTHRGMPMAQARMKRDVAALKREVAALQRDIYDRLGVDPNLPKLTPTILANAMESADLVDEWILTESKQRSTAIKNLREVVVDSPDSISRGGSPTRRADFMRAYHRWSLIGGTYLEKCLVPWLGYIQGTGNLHVNWNATRRSTDREEKGARTGRFSSNPNLQNVPKEVDEKMVKLIGELPNMRGYFVPGNGLVLLQRDYSQQEFRILAHFEKGKLRDAYLRDPKLDMHENALKMVNAMLQASFSRKPIKNMGFAILYGAGMGKTAEMMGVSVDVGKNIKRAYLEVIPGITPLIHKLKNDSLKGLPLITWGGREYFVEPARYIDGHLREFHYKLLNYLIQGSAADCTKEAVIRAWQAGVDLRMQVHDELVALSEPGAAAVKNMKRLKDAMESVEFDVPMLSDGKISKVSFGDLREYAEAA